MVTITDSSIRQNVYETIYDLVNGISFSVSGVTVTAAFVDDAQKIPQVVIHPVDIDYKGFTFDRAASEKDIKVLIDIWTKKNKDKDVLADEIVSTIQGTNVQGIQLVGVGESNALEPQNNNKLHLKSITITYSR